MIRLRHYQVFPGAMLAFLEGIPAWVEEHCLLSGAHIASDMHAHGQDCLVACAVQIQMENQQCFPPGTVLLYGSLNLRKVDRAVFVSIPEPILRLYAVEGADALEPLDSTAITLMRYSENNMSAGVAFRGDYRMVALGFPFETHQWTRSMRDWLMRKTIGYLLKKSDDE